MKLRDGELQVIDESTVSRYVMVCRMQEQSELTEMLCSRSFYSIDVIRVVTMVDLPQGDMSLRVHEHDSERRRYDGGLTSMKRGGGGYVFEFSVSHCDLA